MPIGGYKVVGDSVRIQPYRNHSALADLPTRYSLAELGAKMPPNPS
ncbi:hypothetical protein H9L05_00240 [Hymenobacter qilianensis]|uniref:Uncharacterized protein n=1 Tax=Hymenobacter qilianensis TaxID=1385715 RepID=A0A7H0GVH9_9BACT|nr:hypothetical protein [Hymenobacter qilianensis]QNP52295.1 hypothetical protein H9L05_00240 [Hymenobacter qilianensis]